MARKDQYNVTGFNNP